MEVLHPRCCGIDVHKESLVACLRQQEGRRKHAEVQSFGTTTAEILRLHAWLSAAGCTHVAMESTGVYWQPVFNLLEGSFGVVLAKAHHIKAVTWPEDRRQGLRVAGRPARARTDSARVSFRPRRFGSCGILTDTARVSFAIGSRPANRVHKLLEGANIKLGNVVSDVSVYPVGRCSTALVAGETDPTRLASLARGS